jgi:hypothetical protein
MVGRRRQPAAGPLLAACAAVVALTGALPAATAGGSAPPRIAAVETTNGGFRDVPGGAYYATAAAWLAEEGITTGYAGDPTRFAPDEPVTRAQMAAFLWRMSGRPSAWEGGFLDVPPGSYYQAATGWLLQLGVTTGHGGDPDVFAPDVVVTRAQMTGFLWRLAGRPDSGATGFGDVPTWSWYDVGSRWLRATGITTGFGGDPTRFSPGAPVTRAQMAAFLHRYATARPVARPADLYVLARETGVVTVVDAETLAVTTTVELGVQSVNDIAVAGGALWFSWGGDVHGAPIGRHDLTTGVTDPEAITGVGMALLRSSPAQPDTLYALQSGHTGGRLRRFDVSSSPPRLVLEGWANTSIPNDVELSADGRLLWITAGSPYEVVEVSTAHLAPTPRTLPLAGGAMTVTSTVSRGRQIVVGAANGLTTTVTGYELDGDAVTAALEFPLPHSDGPGFLAVAPDATRVHALISRWWSDPSATAELITVDGASGAVVTVTLPNEHRVRNGVDVDRRTGRVFAITRGAVVVLTEQGVPVDLLAAPDATSLLVVPR